LQGAGGRGVCLFVFLVSLVFLVSPSQELSRGKKERKTSNLFTDIRYSLRISHFFPSGNRDIQYNV
jgi:hypothetical protein